MGNHTCSPPHSTTTATISQPPTAAGRVSTRSLARSAWACLRMPQNQRIDLTGSPSNHLCITGSLAAKAADRQIDEADLRSLTIVDPAGRVSQPPLLANESGISSICPLTPAALAVATGSWFGILTRDDLVQLPNPGRDIHELTRLEAEVVGIASTGTEEVVIAELDVGSQSVHVRQRTDLAELRPDVTRDRLSSLSGRSRFHVNQAFLSPDGRQLALVHHVDGWQPVQQVASRVLKRHGNGGFIDLSDGSARDLGLSAPHSARRVGDDVWICDSGNFTIRRYGPDWSPIGEPIRTAGWGRGMAHDPKAGVIHVGISPVRPRYRSLYSDRLSDEPMVQTFNREGVEVARVPLTGIDQVNGVSLLMTDQIKVIEAWAGKPITDRRTDAITKRS